MAPAFEETSDTFTLDFHSLFTLNMTSCLPHLTLAGVVCSDDDAQMRAVETAKRLCSAVRVQTLQFTGAGAGFGWVWVTTTLTSTMLRLHDELMEAFAAFGEPCGTEPFLPHITIGRVPEGDTVYDPMDWLTATVLTQPRSLIRIGDPFTMMTIGVGISGPHGTLPAQGLEVVHLRGA